MSDMKNIINIIDATYTQNEKRLGILTDEGLNDLLEKFTDIASDRLNAGLVEYKVLQDIVKLFDVLTIERDSSVGNRIIINNWQQIDEVVFDNKSNKSAIEYWLYRGMLNDLAEMIDEAYRYGMGGNDDYDTRKLKGFLYFLNSTYVKIL